MSYLTERYATAVERAEAFPLLPDSAEAVESAVALREAALSRPWPGKTGTSDRLVYVALTEVAIKARSLCFTASRRRLQLDAGIGSLPTVTRALRRLEARKLIAPVPAVAGDQSSRWRLLAAPDNSDEHSKFSSMKGGHWSYCIDSWRTHDAFAAKALGRGAHRVLSVLTLDPQTVAQIAERAGYSSRPAVRKHLNRMSECGLVAPSHGLTWSLPMEPPSLDAIARHYSTLGTAERTRQRVEAERWIYRN